jgi:hypothetical protein
MRNTILLLFICLAIPGGNTVFAQSKIEFLYDNAGNREFRQLVGVNQLKSTDSIPESIIKQHEDLVFDDETFSSVKVYPNPADYLVNIEFSDAPDGAVSLVLYDQQGRLIDTNTFHAFTHTVDVSDFAPGLYFLILRYNEKSTTFRIIKK